MFASIEDNRMCMLHILTYINMHGYVYVNFLSINIHIYIYRFTCNSLKQQIWGCSTPHTIAQIPSTSLHSQHDRNRCLQNRKPRPSPQPWQQSTTIVSIDGIIIARPLASDCTHKKTDGLKTRKEANAQVPRQLRCHLRHLFGCRTS